MQKALLLVEKGKNIKNMEREAARYCEEKNLIYCGNISISAEQIIEEPNKVFQQIKDQQPDVVLSEGSFMMMSEMSRPISVLLLMEEEGIECADMNHDIPVRQYIENIKRTMAHQIQDHESKHVPVIVLYEGTSNYQKDKDFIDIARFIKDKLHCDSFSLVLYKNEHIGMLDELKNSIVDSTPSYIIQRNPFHIPLLKGLMDMIKESSDDLDIKLLDMEDVRAKLYQEQDKNIHTDMDIILH